MAIIVGTYCFVQFVPKTKNPKINDMSRCISGLALYCLNNVIRILEMV